MERILTALGVTKQSSGMERDGLFSSASETTPEEERDLLLYSKYANSVQRVVSLPACRFVGYFEVHEVRTVTRDDGERSVGFVVSRVHEPACSATSCVSGAPKELLKALLPEIAYDLGQELLRLHPEPTDELQHSLELLLVRSLGPVARPLTQALAEQPGWIELTESGAAEVAADVAPMCATALGAALASAMPLFEFASFHFAKPRLVAPDEGSWPWGARAAATSVRKAWRRELEKLVGVLAREGAAGADDTHAEVLKLLDNPHQLATLEGEMEKVLQDKTKVPNSKDRG